MQTPCPLPDFAVFDTETTGLHPDRGDRALEVAIVRLRPDGTTLARYETLLNPGRPVGATHIHGITDADIRDAPAFADVTPADVLSLLSGCVLVAHNAAFDFGFLDAECRLAGLVPGNPFRVCTVLASRRFCTGLFSHKLVNVCRALGVPLDDAHSAMADCDATAAVFLRLFLKMDVPDAASLRNYGAEGMHVFPALETSRPARPAYTRAMARRPPPDRQLTLGL